MSEAHIVLAGKRERTQAIHLIATAPVNTRVHVKGPRRTVLQNDRMWAMLTDIARQLDWHGQKYTADDWKDYFCHALRRARWMPDEDGGMVPVGLRTSDLSKTDHSDLTALMEAFGARHGVTFTEPDVGPLKGQRTDARKAPGMNPA